MEIAFFITAGVLVYTFLGYPAVLWALSLLAGKRVAKGQMRPKVSLIISAYNEQSIIAEKIENCLAIDYPKEKLEIIVASESTDRTNEIVQRYAPQGIVLHAYRGRAGKAATLFRTVPKATGEIIVFSDANAMYEPDAIRKLVHNFNDERIGCVSGQLKYFNPDQSNSGTGELAYWKYEMAIKKLESRFFSLLGANGSIFAIRKELYFPIAEDRGDDFELPIRIRLNGRGVVLEPEAVSWERSSATADEEFKRKVRIIAWNIKSCLLLLKESLLKKRLFLAFQLVSHKLLRWLFPLFAMAMLVINFFLPGTFFRALLYAQVVFYAGAIVGFAFDAKGGKVPRLLVIPYYFCLMHCAASAGLCSLIFNGRNQKTVWEKVRS